MSGSAEHPAGSPVLPKILLLQAKNKYYSKHMPGYHIHPFQVKAVQHNIITSQPGGQKQLALEHDHKMNRIGLTHSLLSFALGTPISSNVLGPLPGGRTGAALAGTEAGFESGAPPMGALASGREGAMFAGFTLGGTWILFGGGRALGLGMPPYDPWPGPGPGRGPCCPGRFCGGPC